MSQEVDEALSGRKRTLIWVVTGGYADKSAWWIVAAFDSETGARACMTQLEAAHVGHPHEIKKVVLNRECE